MAVISQFGQVVTHSGLCKFHSCALFREVSHQGRNEEGKGAEYPGRRKVPKMSQVFSSIQYIYSEKTLGTNMGAPNSFLSPGAI